MAATFNLIRDARVFFTTNLDSAGEINTTGFTDSNTYELQVLDGLSFSQNTTTETVQLNEAGADPTRGQRVFNTALDPVDFSFSTYIRPKFSSGADTVATTDDFIDAEEAVLWNALAAGDAANNGVNGTNGAWSRTTGASPVSTLSFAKSEKNQLQKFGIIVYMDSTKQAYFINNCVMNTATIDFGIDAIATVQWAGQGSTLESITSLTSAPTAKARITTAPFLANKLSTVALTGNGTPGQTGSTYTLALTGGSITISNNVTYLTPANIGVVNKPTTYFTGTRAISGSLNCYLRTGASYSGGLLETMLGLTTNTAPTFAINLHIGGTSSSAVRVTLEMPSVVLAIPAVNTEQVVSTTINFTAQGMTASALDLEAENELTIKYYSNI